MLGIQALLLLATGATQVSECVPRPEDYALMWWAEGFPSHTPEAPWLRCIQTGRYAIALNTETLQVPHFGRVSAGLDYAGAAKADNSIVHSLPPADLSLTISVNGKTYRCESGAKWTQFGGPRLIESGRVMQRADVTGLEFAAQDGSRLHVDARFETVAWPDRLALILAARPGMQPIPQGEPCFGRIGGGYGLSGANHLEIPHSPELEPEQFTLELWAFVPVDYQASPRLSPWLVCKNGNEWVDGNYGIMIIGGRPRAIVNIGGGRENCFQLEAQGGAVVRTEQWNHLAISYDGDTLRIAVNGQPAGELKIGRKRTAGAGGLAFGRRQDNSGDGYHFRGVIDEVRLYDRVLTAEELQSRTTKPEQALAGATPVREWSFDPKGQASTNRPGERWREASMEVLLSTERGTERGRWALPEGEAWDADAWREAALVLSPGTDEPPNAGQSLRVAATEVPAGNERAVEYDPARGWHRIDLNGVAPIIPEGGHGNQNDAVERVRITLTNPDPVERTARLLFEKGAAGIALRFGAPITGVSAFLLDVEGNPTGIPVQISKNWHGRPEGGVYAGQWFHGFSMVRVPPGETVELELNIVYGHYGGVAAASHAQLCLIGWGSNQLWDQSALGSWGESICYEPDQAQAAATVLDVRPLMVRSMNRNMEWNWTHNVGGGDFFRYFAPDGKRGFPARMKTAYLSQCPVLTEVLYAGCTAQRRIEHEATVSLYRSDDIVRGVYRLRMDVNEATPFSRFVICQIGADTYSYTGERKMALGNEQGLVREWDTRWGGDQYRTEPMQCTGRVPWVSLHDAVSRAGENGGAWANRGLIIRSWRARLGGKDAKPWVAEYGVRACGTDTSTIDIIPPPGVNQLQPGDFVEATIEHVILPQHPEDYYGPNANLRSALESDGNTWRMVYREATGNDIAVSATVGRTERERPALIRAEGDRAEFSLEGGLGYVPVTIAGLSRPGAAILETRTAETWMRAPGADVWQADYDPRTGTWAYTFSVRADAPQDVRTRRQFRFRLRD
ncbi:MAG: LamG domain-containing protein [Armatimonadetes bacterium]|nr:LamG domain-containing protein [Armatimonadota bacterium]